MKELNVYDTLIQKEALINELKGNLFEYLVAKDLANTNQVEGQFSRSIPPEFQERLRGYEEWLREHSEELLVKLPVLAHTTARYVADNLPGKLDGVLVVGKLAGGSHDERVREADLLLKQKDTVLPLSLKLCKENSFVNTKSGGARSFFSKYFGKSFKAAFASQKIINNLLDSSYKELSMELHRIAGLPEQEQFGAEWREAELPELPGQLNEQMSSVLKGHYHEMVLEFYNVWEKLYHFDQKIFLDCMMPLLGFGSTEVTQVSCFYKGDYELSYNSFKSAAPYREKLKDAVLHKPKEGLSSFEVEMDDCSFQLRLKPMNKFTVSGLKVNCSLKQLKTC